MIEIFQKLEALFALFCLVITSVLLIESAKETSYYLFVSSIIERVGNLRYFTVYDKRILTYQNTRTQESHKTTLVASGLIVINKHPQVGHEYENEDGDRIKLVGVEIVDRSNSVYIFCAVIFSLSFAIPSYFFNDSYLLYKFILKPFVHSFSMWKNINSIWEIALCLLKFPFLLLLGLLLIYFPLVWGFGSLFKLSFLAADYFSNILTKKYYYMTLSLIVILSWTMTYLCRFIKIK